MDEALLPGGVAPTMPSREDRAHGIEERDHARLGATDLVRLVASDSLNSADKDKAITQLFRLSRVRAHCQALKNAGGYQTLVQLLRVNSASSATQKLFAAASLHQLRLHLGIEGDIDELNALLPEPIAFLPSPLNDALSSCGDPNDTVLADVVMRIGCVASIFPAFRDEVRHAKLIDHLVALLGALDPSLVSEALATLAVLAQGNILNQDAMVEAGVVPHLVRLLLVGSEDQATSASAVVAELAMGSDAASGAVVAAGGLSPLVEVVRTGSAVAKTHAARALSGLARNATAVAGVEKAGAILPLVELLRGSDDRQTLFAAQALANVAQNDYNRLSIARAGGVESLVQLLCFGSGDHKAAAAHAVANLALHSENHAPIVQAGGVTPLVYLVTTGTALQQLHATRALSGLASWPANRALMVDAGAIPPLVELVRSGSVRLQAHAVEVLVKMAQEEPLSVRIVQEGVAEPLVAILQEECEDHEALRRALGALRVFSASGANKLDLVGAGSIERLVPFARSGSNEAIEALAQFAVVGDYQEALRSTGGLAVLVDRLLTEHGNEPKTLQVALRALSANEANAAALVEAGAIDWCIRNLPFERGEDAMETAAFVVQHLARQDGYAVRIAQTDTVTSLTLMLRNGTTDAVRLSAIRALAVLAEAQENRDMVEDARVPEVLADAIRHGSDPVKQTATDALVSLAARHDDRDRALVALQESGAIDSVVMRLQIGSNEHTLASLRVLVRLMSPENHDKIADGGGLNSLMGLLQATDEDLSTEACTLLSRVVRSLTVRKAAIAAGAFASLVTTIANGSDRAKEAAAAALQALVGDFTDAMKVVEAGAVPPLLAMVRSDTVDLRRVGLSVLHRLTRGSDICLTRVLKDDGVVPMMFSVMRGPDEESRVIAAEVLLNMAWSDSSAGVVLATDSALECLVELVHTGSASLQESVANVLGVLASRGGVSGALLVSSGVAKMLVGNLESGDRTVCRRALNVVVALFQEPDLRRVLCDADALKPLQKLSVHGHGMETVLAKDALKHVTILDKLRTRVRRVWANQRCQGQVHFDKDSPSAQK